MNALSASDLKNDHSLKKRATSFLAVFLCTMISSLDAAPDRVELYVSAEADSEGDGTVGDPYSSLPDAVAALRDLRQSGETKPSVIYLREGRHELRETLVLSREDGDFSSDFGVEFSRYGAGEKSGSGHLMITSFPGETAIISGGIPVKGWQRLEEVSPELAVAAVGKVWVADIPEGITKFYTLYDEQGRLNRARGNGFAMVKQGTKREFSFPEGALKSWSNLRDVEIHTRTSRAWVTNMLPLESVDVASGVARTAVTATYGMGPLPRYLAKFSENTETTWVENALEVLDEPGEWVVNTKTRKIYLWPSDPSSDGSPKGILAPAMTELIRVEGEIDYDGPEDKPVRGIAFSGLTFTHADRWAWTSDETRLGWGIQHDWDMFDRPTAMLRFRGSENCSVLDCRFIDAGGSGVRMDLHAQYNRVEGCEFAHLGEAGILLAGYGPGTKDVNHHNDIINNYIHHFGEISWHSPGIWAWQSGRNRIAHNELHHSAYSAILLTNRIRLNQSQTGEGGQTLRHAEISEKAKQHLGEQFSDWQVREKYNHSRHNLVEYNRISHCVQRLADGNAIYVSGGGTGNIIRYNFFFDNPSIQLPALIRCDDDQHETLIHGNVLTGNIGRMAGIASKGVNDITNNFIVSPTVKPSLGYISFEWEPVSGSIVKHNVIISHPSGGLAHKERLKGQSPEALAAKPNIEETEMNSNLYFHPTDPTWVDDHLVRLRAVGREDASRFGDPRFVDPAAEDFSFQPGSPALDLGIEPLNTSKMGRFAPASVE